MRENGGRDDSKWPPLALWPYSAEKIFLIRVCRGLRAAPNAAFTSGVVDRKHWMHTLPTSPSPSASSPSQSPAVTAPPKGSPWHSGKVSGLSATCPVLPRGVFPANGRAHSVSGLDLSASLRSAALPKGEPLAVHATFPAQVQSVRFRQSLSLWERWMRTQ